MSSTESHKKRKRVDAPTHLLFSPSSSSSPESAVFFVPFISHEGYVKRSIYIGQLYKNYPRLAREFEVPIEKVERAIKRNYHPVHLIASLSHEELHRVLLKLGEVSASHNIDRLQFGRLGTRQPSGLPSETFMKLPQREISRRLKA